MQVCSIKHHNTVMKNKILAQTFQMWVAMLDKRDVQRPGVSSVDFLPVDPARKQHFWEDLQKTETKHSRVLSLFITSAYLKF